MFTRLAPNIKASRQLNMKGTSVGEEQLINSQCGKKAGGQFTWKDKINRYVLDNLIKPFSLTRLVFRKKCSNDGLWSVFFYDVYNLMFLSFQSVQGK